MERIGTSNFAKHEDRFYGNYRAKVENNVDPLMLGRVRVRVYPMLMGVEDIETLPWAVPAMSIGSGAGLDTTQDPPVSFGNFDIPAIGSWVWVFFEMGDIYQPVFFAGATAGLSGLPAARATNTDPEDYPFIHVYRSEHGIQIKINDYVIEGDEPRDARSYRIDHPSGSWMEFFPSGAVTIHTTKPGAAITLETTEADISLNATKGNISIHTSEGAVTVDSTKGDVSITAEEGKMDIKSSGPMVIQSTDTVTVAGSMVRINPL